MKQGRKTTFEGRIEIVTFTMVHNKNYHAAVVEVWGLLPTSLLMGEKV